MLLIGFLSLCASSEPSRQSKAPSRAFNVLHGLDAFARKRSWRFCLLPVWCPNFWPQPMKCGFCLCSQKEAPLQGALGALCIPVLSGPMDRGLLSWKRGQNQETEDNHGPLSLLRTSLWLCVTNFFLISSYRSISSCEGFALCAD